MNGIKPLDLSESAILKAAKKRREDQKDQVEEELSHTPVQYELIKLGNALGYQSWVARNDRSKEWRGERFSMLTAESFPKVMNTDADQQTVELIDVIWLDGNKIRCAFEIEHSTSIYSGALRLFDLAKTIEDDVQLFIAAPDSRSSELARIMSRPTFSEEVAQYQPKYLPYNELCNCCSDIAKFSQDWRGLDAIAKTI